MWPRTVQRLAGIRANDVIISVNDKPAVSALETMDQVAGSARVRKFRWSSCVMIRKSRSISPSEYPATN